MKQLLVVFLVVFVGCGTYGPDKQGSDTDTYTVAVKCSNCGFYGDVQSKIGIHVGQATCPTCRTKCLRRDLHRNHRLTHPEVAQEEWRYWRDISDLPIQANRNIVWIPLYRNGQPDGHLEVEYQLSGEPGHTRRRIKLMDVEGKWHLLCAALEFAEGPWPWKHNYEPEWENRLKLLKDEQKLLKDEQENRDRSVELP